MSNSSDDAIDLTVLAPAHVEDVFVATEQVRAEAFPDVHATLLFDVLSAERDNPDSRLEAARAVGRAIDEYLLAAERSESKDHNTEETGE